MATSDVTRPDERAQALRVVVADDNALLREGIASLLEEAGHTVVGRAGDADDLLLKVRSYSPDVAIVDVRMPPGYGEEGLAAAAEIRSSFPDVAVLVLSQHLEPEYALRLLAIRRTSATSIVPGSTSTEPSTFGARIVPVM